MNNFIQDALYQSKVTESDVTISNECCSSELSIHRIIKKKNITASIKNIKHCF